jgi:hypothetical protein
MPFLMERNKITALPPFPDLKDGAIQYGTL